ncbi:MAG TPA: SAM-dependent chlorinase/fluorinase [Verrucomicrobiae bacterium]|nr:SAM-dependent chlorinase/fluorinase [Verrucomicrobiae bacterium]
MALQRLITFTTDFGLTEHYVGAMKGVIYDIHPTAQIVDITNGVQSFDLLDGALAISQAYNYFPKDTVHLVLVDPGVGGPRRPILATNGDHFFVAPDNGVLSLVYEREERVSVRHITSTHYFRQPVSYTFHGRDIFAPIAAYLSKGVEVAKFGDEITDQVRFLTPKPKSVAAGSWKAVVLKVDKFGNLITSITAADIPDLFRVEPPPFTLTVGKANITKFQSSYVQGVSGEVFAILGSSGFLEISANRGSAARLSGADKGSEVSLVLS